MEELRSTDILDKEIQNDARKKAESIIAAGKAEAEKVLAQVASRLEKAETARGKTLAEKEVKHKKDMEASIPLEKQRFLVSFVEKSVNEALGNYLKKLSQDARLAMVLKSLDGFSIEKKFSAKVYGFDVKKAQEQIEKKLSQKLISCKEIDPSLSGEDPIEGIEIREGIILEAEDSSVKCRLTLLENINSVKDKYSKELVDALLPNIGGLE